MRGYAHSVLVCGGAGSTFLDFMGDYNCSEMPRIGPLSGRWHRETRNSF